jgi:hypothetical protein
MSGKSKDIIEFFPYPMAIFGPDYTLFMVNDAFAEETNIRPADVEKGEVRILRYKADDMQLAAAITHVFDGKTTILEDLKDPFSVFSGVEQQKLRHGRYTQAVVFPITSDDDAVTHGVIVIMP